MHIAWSPNDCTNSGPMAARSEADLAHTVSASWIGAIRAATESSFGKPSCAALIVIWSLVGSTATFASKPIVSCGGVDCAVTDALTPPAAWHWPFAPPPPLPADAEPEQPAD